MLKCKQISERASEYIDGNMSMGQRFQFRLHLMMCQHCQRFVKNFNTGIVMIQRLRKVPECRPEQLEAVQKRIQELEKS